MQFEKMRVCLAAQFFSHSTAAAIDTCVKLNLLPVEALTTAWSAWFLGFVNSWFDAMNARHIDSALFRNQKKEILHDMLSVIKDLSFSGRKVWKPIQTGIQLSTNVVLQRTHVKLQSAILSDWSPLPGSSGELILTDPRSRGYAPIMPDVSPSTSSGHHRSVPSGPKRLSV